MEINTTQALNSLSVWGDELSTANAVRKLETLYQTLIQLETTEMIGRWERHHSLDLKDQQFKIKELRKQKQELIEYIKSNENQALIKLNISIEIQ